MTTQKSIERLARFMGWHRGKYSDSWYRQKEEVAPYEDSRAAPSTWNPFTRLDDAFMVAEMIGGLTLQHGAAEGCWYASFNVGVFINTTRNGRSPAAAIALAALAYLDAMEKTR